MSHAHPSLNSPHRTEAEETPGMGMTPTQASAAPGCCATAGAAPGAATCTPPPAPAGAREAATLGAVVALAITRFGPTAVVHEIPWAPDRDARQRLSRAELTRSVDTIKPEQIHALSGAIARAAPERSVLTAAKNLAMARETGAADRVVASALEDLTAAVRQTEQVEDLVRKRAVLLAAAKQQERIPLRWNVSWWDQGYVVSLRGHELADLAKAIESYRFGDAVVLGQAMVGARETPA